MRGHRWKTVFGLLLTVVLLWWVLRDVSIAEVLHRVRGADVWLLIGSVVLATFSFVLRAIRWRILLLPAHDTSRYSNRFGATCIGFTVNNLLPARLGEFARAYALSRTEQINIGASVASLVAERVFDGLVLALFLFATISLPGFPLGEGGTASLVRRTANVGALLFVAAFIVLWLAARQPTGSIRLFEGTIGRLVPHRFRGRTKRIVSGFLEGLGALRDPAVFLRAMGWSVVVWLNLSASVWLGLLAFDITAPGFIGSIFLQSVIAFAVAAPSSPGFFGVFEAAARIGLGVYGVAPTDTVSFATSYHILSFIPVTVIGLWYIRRFGLSLSEMSHSEGAAEAGAEAEAGEAG